MSANKIFLSISFSLAVFATTAISSADVVRDYKAEKGINNTAAARKTIEQEQQHNILSGQRVKNKTNAADQQSGQSRIIKRYKPSPKGEGEQKMR